MGLLRWTGRGLTRFGEMLAGDTAPASGVPQTVTKLVPLGRVGAKVYTEADRTTIADDGYRRASLIHACITEFATSIAEPPLVGMLGDGIGAERLPANAPLSRLAARPNPDMTPYEYTERVATDLKIYGEAFVAKLRAGNGQIGELYPMRVDRMEVIPGRNGEVDHYELLNLAGGLERTFVPRDIMHIKLYNPLNDYRGLSPIFVLLVEGQLDKDAILFLGEFFRNGGLPSVVLTSEQKLTPTDRELIRAEYRNNYGRGGGGAGSTNWHEAMVLSHGATVQPLGVDPSKLDLAPMFDVAESRVCSVMGVPAILVGVAIGLRQSQAYGTAREARRGWWGETLRPFCERLSQVHSLSVASEFGQGKRLSYDLSNVQALLEAQTQVSADAVSAFNSYLLTRDEARKRIGLHPIDNADVTKDKLVAALMAATSNQAQTNQSAAASALPLGPRRLDLPELVGAAAE